ncbi:Uma2 family endonuclease (plasmid) [Streptomyces sp. NBC_01558]|uniref:Uma2 family endonuclease n=1 Tax=Streptomyces sp. NBC_01558 TaxID=2975878 RepID=UPI002DD7E04D|nr:Uma2 family endonuclease [Streptomyces sp. NBC_01558]WSD82710.1 Uma2 family endonuclease [Streptomyces sp. NBC_01558]
MSSAPGVRHQRASFRLHVILAAAARAAGAPVEVIEAINVVLPSGLVVPDLVITDAGATAEDTVSVDADAVQLGVELVSPGNKTMDRKVKPLLYAEAAIPHFWSLDFEPAPRLIVSELQGGRYVETVTALAGTTTRINAPFSVDIDPAGLARQ